MSRRNTFQSYRTFGSEPWFPQDFRYLRFDAGRAPSVAFDKSVGAGEPSISAGAH